MELRHLRYFVALAEELSFTRAARRLHVSQPPLSLQISQLEQEIGARLFQRTSRRVELTLAGQAFLTDAQAVLARVGEAGSRARAIAQGLAGRIDIGLSGSHFLGPLPRIMAGYAQSHPEVEVSLHELKPAVQLQALRERRIDLSVSRTPVNDAVLSSTLLWRDPVAVALPTGHSLARRRQLRLLDLRAEPFVMLRTDSSAHAQYIQDCCVQAGFSPQVSQRLLELPAMLSLVAAGMGVALIPSSLRSLFPDRIKVTSLGKDAPHADVYAVQRSVDTSVVAQEFVRLAAASVTV
nr:LysR substrate-binding domain-containing protein [Rhodoferax sp.]